jgi:NADH:ubiquinone oxidoreductase subunit F (NADH-binding)
VTGSAVRSGVRLLAGWAETGRPADLAAHRARYGPVPLARDAASVVREVEEAGLRGRGGAGFPTGRKLAAVAAARGRPVVLANGCEGDPTSSKDAVLLRLAPHLVLDGIVLAAHAVGAREAVLCVHAGSPVRDAVAAAVRERTGDPVRVRVVEVARRYLTGQETALVNALNTGDPRPTVSPPRPAQRGLDGRPTLVDNVETLAHLALVVRLGAEWFRRAGTPDSPGTTLVTVGGAVAGPGVYEVEHGAPLGHVLDLAGGLLEPPAALQVGGLAGTWLPPRAVALPLARRAFDDVGAALGLSAVYAVPQRACGLAETARVLAFAAAESARQCGPCMFGLPAVALDAAALAWGTGADARAALDRLERRLGLLAGRGACAHPDGTARFAASALRLFAADVAAHVAGRPCAGRYAAAVLPVPDRTGRR